MTRFISISSLIFVILGCLTQNQARAELFSEPHLPAISAFKNRVGIRWNKPLKELA
jgi:hypothetical protein